MTSSPSLFFIILLLSIHNTRPNSTAKSQFQFTDEARAALCPFVGTKGMQCFDDGPTKFYGTQPNASIWKLPRGVGISIDRSTGRLKALAVQLTYSPETGRTWTDGFTGEMFDVCDEIQLGPAARVAATYNTSRIRIFRNASQLNAAWQQTYIDGKIRGGFLANSPDLYKFMNEFARNDEAMVVFQSITGLYTLTIDPSRIRLNPFARDALSKLTVAFEPHLYEDFVNNWGTHIITKALIGGMIEEQAKVMRCFHGDERSLVIRCLSFGDRHSSNPLCKYYREQNKLVARRRLGGNVESESNQEWTQSLALAPAMVEILEMVPWYEFVAEESIKGNLRTIIWHREEMMDFRRAQEISLIDSRLAPCRRVIPKLPVDARWEQTGITIAAGNGRGINQNQLYSPHGFLIENDHDGDGQTFTIVDHGNHRIMQWKSGDTCGKIVAGGNGQGNRLDQLNWPTDVLIDKETNSLIIADRFNARVVRWSRRSGTTRGEILINGISCFGLVMDEQRNLYVSDIQKHEVRRYDMDRDDRTGTLVAGGHGKGSGLNQLNCPLYLFVDRNQSLYISDCYNHRVIKWDKDATQGTIVAGGQGMGSAISQLYYPNGIVVDLLGSLYVADTWNHRVTRWSLRAKESTLVVGGNGEGSAANQFIHPITLSFDKQGNLYVVEYGNHRVQRFNIKK